MALIKKDTQIKANFLFAFNIKVTEINSSGYMKLVYLDLTHTKYFFLLLEVEEKNYNTVTIGRLLMSQFYSY